MNTTTTATPGTCQLCGAPAHLRTLRDLLDELSTNGWRQAGPNGTPAERAIRYTIGTLNYGQSADILLSGPRDESATITLTCSDQADYPYERITFKVTNAKPW